jgi:cell division protein FtsL
MPEEGHQRATMVRRLPSKQRNALVVQRADRAAQRRLAFLLLCGLVLAGGFLYACGLHFAALRYGYQTETLRREREQLLEEQRRFLLEREEAASPVRLERAARQLGMQPMQPGQMDPLRAARNRSPKSPEKKSVAMNHPAVSPPTAKGELSAAKTEGRQRFGAPR